MATVEDRTTRSPALWRGSAPCCESGSPGSGTSWRRLSWTPTSEGSEQSVAAGGKRSWPRSWQTLDETVVSTSVLVAVPAIRALREGSWFGTRATTERAVREGGYLVEDGKPVGVRIVHVLFLTFGGGKGWRRCGCMLSLPGRYRRCAPCYLSPGAEQNFIVTAVCCKEIGCEPTSSAVISAIFAGFSPLKK